MKSLMIPDHTAFKVRSSGEGRAGIFRSSEEAFAWDATRRLQFVVHAAVGFTPWRSTDMQQVQQVFVMGQLSPWQLAERLPLIISHCMTVPYSGAMLTTDHLSRCHSAYH